MLRLSKQRPMLRLVRQQQGSVLMWGMVILLTLTVIGVAAARMGLMDTHIVGNEMYAMMTYQSAESQLNRVRPPSERVAPDAALSLVNDAVNNNGEKRVDSKTENASDVLLSSGGLKPHLTIEDDGKYLSTCPSQQGMAGSSEMGGVAGAYRCRLFRITSTSVLENTGAGSQHEMGIVQYTPYTP